MFVPFVHAFKPVHFDVVPDTLPDQIIHIFHFPSNKWISKYGIHHKLAGSRTRIGAITALQNGNYSSGSLLQIRDTPTTTDYPEPAIPSSPPLSSSSSSIFQNGMLLFIYQTWKLRTDADDRALEDIFHLMNDIDADAFIYIFIYKYMFLKYNSTPGLLKRMEVGWEDGRQRERGGGKGGREGEESYFRPSSRRHFQLVLTLTLHIDGKYFIYWSNHCLDDYRRDCSYQWLRNCTGKALERHWKGTRRALANMKNGMGGAWVEENNKRRPSLDNCKLEPERHGKANRGKLTNNRSNYTRSITIIKLQQIGNNFRRAVWGLRDIREERPETLRIQTNNRYSLSRRKNALRSRWSCKNARICGTRTCGGAPITAPIQPEPIEIECVTYLIHQTLVIVPQNRPAKSARKIDRPPPSAGMMTGLPPPLENAQRFRYSLVVYYYYYFVFFRIEFTAHHSQS